MLPTWGFTGRDEDQLWQQFQFLHLQAAIPTSREPGCHVCSCCHLRRHLQLGFNSVPKPSGLGTYLQKSDGKIALLQSFLPKRYLRKQKKVHFYEHAVEKIAFVKNHIVTTTLLLCPSFSKIHLSLEICRVWGKEMQPSSSHHYIRNYLFVVKVSATFCCVVKAKHS